MAMDNLFISQNYAYEFAQLCYYLDFDKGIRERYQTRAIFPSFITEEFSLPRRYLRGQS